MSLERFIKDYEAGEIIFEEGAPGNEMYVVKEGEVSIETTIKTEGKSIIKNLGVLSPGDFFGEMAIIGGENRSARALARTRTQLVTLNKNRFYELIENSPEFAIKIVRKFSDRLNEANQRLRDYLALSKKSTILLALKELTESQEEAVISIDSICEGALLSQQELEPILAQLIQIGLVQLEESTVRISDREELSKLVSLLNLLESSQ
ncbi:MAG: hypothetical protein CVV50_03320 [Spirochaetae bacterium HGW-Spirochaetae-6]|nr:MAG: hypothetical protein CVV50_03320 [Spirochaetae bacterium HGW-Spirochaetae-6]